MSNVKPYRLHGIYEDNCWALFTKHVFGNVDCDAHPDLKEIGIQFVKNCKGLPLAVKSIAGLLRSMMSLEAWKGILESDIWKLDFHSTNILPVLWLSYSFLPPHLKRCFAFLSVFPKDYIFHDKDREKIVLMWMAEGLVQPQNNRRVEDVGEEYLNVLISRSFFQKSIGYHLYGGHVLLMHDLIHDLAIFVSSGLHSNSSKTRYFSLEETYEGLFKLEKSVDTTFLRTCIVLPASTEPTESTLTQKVLREALSRGGCLRALSLFISSIKELPHSIGSLKHLRYMDLSLTEIEDLPNSVCSLYNLQTLLLTGCKKLTHLPTDMSRLINLRHLDIEGTYFSEMPKMCNMKGLQALSYYVLSERHGSRIKDLGALQLLRGSFRLLRLQNVINVEDALGASVKNKRYLDKIRFEWDTNCTIEDLEKETEVLNALEPHSMVKEVEVIGFRGTKLPNWVAEQSFRDMVKVSLIHCRNCRSLPPFGNLPSLKDLKILGMNEMVSIGDEFFGTTCEPFPSLESLFFKNMSSWEKWSLSGSEQGGGVVAVFPRLKWLRIEECGELNAGLPVGSLPALEIIDIHGCNEMATVFPNETGCYSSSLNSITVDSCKILESFSGTGLPPSLTHLSVWECPRLMLNRPSWGLQRLSSLQLLSLHGDLEEYSFPEEGLLPTRLKELTIFDCESLKGLSDKGFQNLTALYELSIYGCQQLRCFPAEGLPLSLKKLCIGQCPLLEKQCMRGTGQYWPNIQHIPEIIIDLNKI